MTEPARGPAACIWLALALLVALPGPVAGAGRSRPPRVLLPPYHLQPDALGIVVNDADPLSRRIAALYQRLRRIPARNLLHVRLPAQRQVVPPRLFRRQRARLLAAKPPSVQAFLLTWRRPYRVGCMSITTAFAAGFDHRWCSAHQCAATRRSPYFNNGSLAPGRELHLYPTMLLPAGSLAQARRYIERGIASDDSRPRGTAYLVSTRDRARNVRSAMYPMIRKAFGALLPVVIHKGKGIRHRHDVLFYFTGRVRVPYLDSLRFLPGALADHLTSFGGRLDPRNRQMRITAWLRAGATGSYGTVVEPCNLPGKFPNIGVLMYDYLQGASLIEAYWRSVAMPGEGLFVGEPLATPFGGYRIEREGDHWILDTRVLGTGLYRLETADSLVGPFHPEDRWLRTRYGRSRYRLPDLGRRVYRLVALVPRARPGTRARPLPPPDAQANDRAKD